MAIHFRCGCGRDYSVQAKRAGKTILCPACGEPVTVPHLPHGERRKGDRRKSRGEGPHTERRRRDRRRVDRRAPGGPDLSHLPEYVEPDPMGTTEIGAGRTMTPKDATPLPPGQFVPPEQAAVPSSLYAWLRVAEAVLGAALVASVMYAIAWLFFL